MVFDKGRICSLFSIEHLCMQREAQHMIHQKILAQSQPLTVAIFIRDGRTQRKDLRRNPMITKRGYVGKNVGHGTKIPAWTAIFLTYLGFRQQFEQRQDSASERRKPYRIVLNFSASSPPISFSSIKY